jgi:hypothetical protein
MAFASLESDIEYEMSGCGAANAMITDAWPTCVDPY